MKRNQYFSAFISVVAAASLTIAFFSESAKAITDTVFRYSTPQTGHFMIPPAALNATTDFPPYRNEGFRLTNLGTSAQTCLQAPVNLPQGAVIKSIRIWYGRQTSNATFFADLKRVRLTATGPSTLPPIAGSGDDEPPINDGFSVIVYDAAAHTVDNRLNLYYLELCIASGAVFYSARIDYTYDTAGD
jgi:hypothetical protein